MTRRCELIASASTGAPRARWALGDDASWATPDEGVGTTDLREDDFSRPLPARVGTPIFVSTRRRRRRDAVATGPQGRRPLRVGMSGVA